MAGDLAAAPFDAGAFAAGAFAAGAFAAGAFTAGAFTAGGAGILSGAGGAAGRVDAALATDGAGDADPVWLCVTLGRGAGGCAERGGGGGVGMLATRSA